MATWGENLPNVLVVDDEAAIRRLAVCVLDDRGFECRVARDVTEALAAVAAAEPDVVVTDIEMPGPSGFALVAQLRARHPSVAIVMMTAHAGPEVVEAALDGGVHAYVVKPFEPNALAVAVFCAVRRRDLELENARHRLELSELVGIRTSELEQSRAEAVERLALAVESRDPGTGAHVERMSALAARLGAGLGWAERDCETLRLAAVLHDVGKVGVPDAILLKPGLLEPDERVLMESHASTGHAILAGARSELLRMADRIAWTHHERFDGGGYPRHLAGQEIPLAGRIAAVADVYDALTSDRPYREAYDDRVALEMIRSERGAHFDPQVVDALLAVHA